MPQVTVDRPQNLEFPEPAAHHGCCSLIFKVAAAVAHFFRTIGLWFAGVASWLKDRVVDLFPEQTATRWDPRRVFVRTVLDVAPDQRAAVLQCALRRISPQMDQNARERLIQLVNNQNSNSSVSRGMLRFITPDMCSSNSIETIAAIALLPREERDAIMFMSIGSFLKSFAENQAKQLSRP